MATIAAHTRSAPTGAHATSAPDAQWYKNAVIYELHVRSFCDSTGDGVGDFRGLISKLDYLADLGVTAVWLLPFCPSPLRDDGYDTADYTSVNPSYGTIEDAREFIKAAHVRGIRVITEMVLNHTSDQHAWFQRARRAPKGSPEREFYVWSDSPRKYDGVRIIFKDFESSNWAWDPVAGQYYWHRFYAHQPDLNYDNPLVHDAVLEACEFWLEAGVDGMRLDAVPYLYEREGTSCENLPETHAFLRTLRERISTKYPRAMLLAEANQWPEDAIAYFGKGDDCHMAFHFPLMPRLFMALRMEDRYPIIDILEQTPPIPPSCQWALFLRNHDELTLEMVTDEERDYMYRVYANDREARINLGIRRRLAPLLSNNRRKIELMNALLFSLPGTPVIYYGDEIGMGDNVFLGDRDGVRMPMQWSGDRNAGFSRANPQRLFLPTIIDPEYHFETLNVESQLANPSSLLWWMKRLVALRKRHSVFGHGDIRFLSPNNHHALAFVRTHGNQSVLVVANLSRFVQPVTLDLSDFKGRRPVEMFGSVTFPTVGEGGYFLSLGPHSFYWFLLERESEHGDSFESVPELRVGGSGAEFLASPGREQTIERAMLASLPHKRWFMAKSRTLRAARVTGLVPLREGSTVEGTPAGSVALVRCEFSTGEPESYAIPLCVRAAAELPPSPAALFARLVDDSGARFGLIDAMQEPAFLNAMLALMQTNGEARSAGALLRGERLSELADTAPGTVKPASLEQSNSSAFLGEHLMLKLQRRVEGGVNPELEIGRHLARGGRFTNLAPLAGAIHLRDDRDEDETLAVVLGQVPNQGDAWGWTMSQVVQFFERVAARSPLSACTQCVACPHTPLDELTVPPDLAQLIGEPVDALAMLGERTAELHAALADDHANPAFTPEPFTIPYQRSLGQSLRNTVRQTLAQLSRAAWKDDSPRLAAQRLIASEATLLDSVAPLSTTPLEGYRIRCHGDYHLGQVLRTGKDFVIIDFEGEPTRSIGERRLKRSPLRDIAGMIRSIDYAAWAGLRTHQETVPGAPGAALAAQESAARSWSRWMGCAYAWAYRRRLEELRPELLGSNLPTMQLLLRAWLLEKALYEVAYELNARPAWAHIPLRALDELTSRAPQPRPTKGVAV